MIDEDIITDLSKLSELHVIARNSTFIYKGKPVDVKQVRRALPLRARWRMPPAQSDHDYNNVHRGLNVIGHRCTGCYDASSESTSKSRTKYRLRCSLS